MNQSHPSALSLTLIHSDKTENRKPYRKPNSKVAQPKQKKKSAFRNYIESYYREKRAKGHSEQTCIKNSPRLYQLTDWLEKQGCKRPQDVSVSLMDEYVRYLHSLKKKNTQEPLALSTKSLALDTIIVFFKWLNKKGYILSDPVSHVKPPVNHKRLPVNTFTPEETTKIIEQPKLSNHHGYRDKAILELLYATGMRREELRTLLVSDIDFDDNTILIRDGKCDQDRRIPISHRAVIALKDHIKLRPSPIDKDYLFLTGHGSILCAAYLGRLVKKYVRQANIGKDGSFLIFRHTVATQMLEGGADIRYIQQFLGHKRIENTQIYTHVSINKLKEMHQRSHPRARG